MIVDIIATGDEIRTGTLVDSNSAYIAARLEEAGVPIARHTCVGDDLADLQTLFKETAQRADIAVVTGGLGPTVDDLTARAAAEAKGVDLRPDSEALDLMTRFYKTRNYTLNSQNRRQASLPETAACIANPVGTAPGFELRMERCVFYFMPGVPHEMRRMLKDSVLPAIQAAKGVKQPVPAVRTICSFGLPESIVDEKLSGIAQKFPDLKLGLRASFPIIQVKLYVRNLAGADLDFQLDTADKWVCDRLGDTVFSRSGEAMETALGKLLSVQKATLAVAESCTGGLISSLLTDVPGSSAYFLFSGVTYANQAKEKILGVPPETLAHYGAVHAETARLMACGARKLSGADYAIATSGIAGPDGGSDDKPVGTLCVGLATPWTSRGYRYDFPLRERSQNKILFAVVAMNKLRKALLNTGIMPSR